MKKIIFDISNLLTLTLMLTLMTACTTGKFKLEGNITEAKDSMLYLEHMSLDGPQAIDSVKLDEKGSFSFSVDANKAASDSVKAAPEFYRLRIDQSIINICADSTETVTVEAKYPTMSTEYEVKGSEDCQKIKELSLMQQQLLGRVIALSNDNSIDAQTTNDSIQHMVDAYKEKVSREYIFSAPQRPYAYFALFQALGPQLIFDPQQNEKDCKTFGAVATAWDTYYPGSQRGENLHNITIEGMKTQRIQQVKAQGLQVDPSMVTEVSLIDVPLVDNKGKQRSLKELKGKVVMLDFHLFASDQSAERIMQLRELYNKYHHAGLEIYQVSIDGNQHFWKTQTAALPWISVNDPDGQDSQYLQRYNVQQIPTFFLISRDGTVSKRDAQIQNIDAEIQKLL